MEKKWHGVKDMQINYKHRDEVSTKYLGINKVYNPKSGH